MCATAQVAAKRALEDAMSPPPSPSSSESQLSALRVAVDECQKVGVNTGSVARAEVLLTAEVERREKVRDYLTHIVVQMGLIQPCCLYDNKYW